MRTFTDEAGQEFELITVGSGGSLNTGDVVIRPIKAVEKLTHYLHFWAGSNNAIQYDPSLIDNAYELTKPQAQAITAMLEAAMEYVQTPTNSVNRTFTASEMLAESSALTALQEKAMAARAAIQEDV